MNYLLLLLVLLLLFICNQPLSVVLSPWLTRTYLSQFMVLTHLVPINET